MCDFLTLGLPESAIEELTRISAANQLELVPYSNPGLAGHFSKGLITCLVLRGGCSCGLVGEPSKGTDEIERRRRKYEAKGWSKGKIERALMAVDPSGLSTGLHRNAHVVVSRACSLGSRFALFARTYTGPVEDAHDVLLPRKHARTAAVAACEIVFERGVVYWIDGGCS